MSRILVIATLFCLAACVGVADEEPASGLLAVLEANETWPYEVVGVLDIVEAGFDGTSDYADWAVGSIVNDETDEFGIPIEIQGPVIKRGRIDIDSGRPVKAWLEAPRTQYGIETYPVSRLEAL